METEVEKQEGFYNKYWRAMEEEFEQSKRKDLFNKFVRHYLTIKIGKAPNKKRVYEAFKDYRQKEGIGIEDLLKDLQKYCGYFCKIVFKKETDKDLNIVFKKETDKDLNKALGFLVDLEMDVIYPLLLELYSDYKSDDLSKADFIPTYRFDRELSF